VWVNRIWQWHFGRGLVKSSGDFGTQGTRPTHPELLDWLASELIDGGWSTNHIHRLILQSTTYRLSSAFSEANDKLDPENLTYWRWQPRRLEAEVIRDSMLSVSGQIDLTSGGPSVPRDKIAASRRRSLYQQQKRDNLPHQQTLFDGPPALTSCARRRVSTVSLQPLYMLNSSFMQQMATSFAERIRKKAKDTENQVMLAIRLALARDAHAGEFAKAKSFLQNGSLEDFCLVMLNLNEFVYVE
jgi:hypothetical protein